MIKLLIFDVGGVLRDTSQEMFDSFKKAFKSEKVDFPFFIADVWHLRGVGKYNSSRLAIAALISCLRSDIKLKGVLDKNDPEEYLDKLIEKCLYKEDEKLIDSIRSVYKKEFHWGPGSLVKIIDGVPKALDKISKRYKLAIFSNSKVISIKRDLGKLIDNFSVVVSEEDVKNKKPSGEGILKVCKKCGVKPNEVAYIGDAQIDVLAAKDAGCKSIVVLSGMGLKNHLETLKPDYIFKDLEELAENFNASTD